MGTFSDRRIVLESSHNFRDLGGYRTSDGRTTQWARLYRSDSLHMLSETDVEVLHGLGLRTVIDLRSAHELEHHGRDRIDEEVFGYTHVPLLDNVVIDRDPDAPMTPLDASDAYLQMAVGAASNIARCFELLAAPGAMPAVFHCAVGKDRTGIIAALLLAAVGVVDDDVVRDYAMTSESWAGRELFLEQHDATFLAFLRGMPRELLESPPGAIQRFLDGVRREHGSVRAFLATLGIDEATVARLEDGLLVA